MSSSQERQKDYMHVDLHVHSKYSSRPSQWILQKLNCPESYSEPRLIYQRAKAKGMDLVTISDHNSIAGALEIAHMPDVFLSEEVTTYFPDDRCKLHVLALNINEQQHREIQMARENVFELVDYFQSQEILHVLAHPFFDMNHLLTWEHLEQLLLLFEFFEINGAREETQNSCLKGILNGLDAKTVETLAEKHGIRPRHETPWRKVLVAGSDDHSSLHIARMYTRVWSAQDRQSCLQALAQGKCQPQGTPASPRTLAHNLYGIAYQFYRSKFQVTEMAANDNLLQFADCILTGAAPRNESLLDRFPNLLSLRKLWTVISEKGEDSSLEVLLKETQKFLHSSPELLRRIKENPCSLGLEDDWFHLVSRMVNRMGGIFSDKFLESISEARLVNMFQTLGSAASIYTLLAPYLLAYTIFSRDKQFSRHCMQRFKAVTSQEPYQNADFKLAAFTDTFNQMNGVTLTLQQQLAFAQSKGMSLSVLTCGQESSMKGVINFPSQGTFVLPEYPDQTFHHPPFLDLLDFCHNHGFSHILASTPGPMGLAALATARILKLPIYGTYHTALPQHVKKRTGDADLEKFIWKAMQWFYNQMDQVFVPSKSTAEELIAKGIKREKVQIYPRGIDIGRFHPAKRNGYWKQYFQDSDEQNIKLLYVGRISKEKNLDLLVEAYSKYLSCRKDVKLIIVGDGPERQALQLELSGNNILFTGSLQGEELAQAYACSDLFVFPSSTDTFGNVVLEAQSSGLPVIVTDKGGPQENMIPGETGFVVPAKDAEALARTIHKFLDNPELLTSMKKKARMYCQKRSLEAAFLQHWQMFQNFGQPISPL
ncbi:MAG: glycosyltransferase [Desulfohalobiaceae bacterium]